MDYIVVYLNNYLLDGSIVYLVLLELIWLNCVKILCKFWFIYLKLIMFIFFLGFFY